MKNVIIKCTLALSMAAFFSACEKHEHPAPTQAAHDDHDGHDHDEHGHDEKEHEGHDHANHEGHDHDEHEHDSTGPNGGLIIEIGEHEAHVEVVHNESEGSVSTWFYGPELGKALELEKAPSVFAVFDGKRTAIELKPTSGKAPASAFTVTDERLKAHLHGTLNFMLKGKVHNPALPGHDNH